MLYDDKNDTNKEMFTMTKKALINKCENLYIDKTFYSNNNTTNNKRQ